MQSKEDFIEMRVPASAEYVSLIRLTLSGVFSRAGATYDDIEDAKIAVSEAVTNAVKHAYKENNNVGIINIYFEILEDKIKIVISDKGDSFDYETTKSKIVLTIKTKYRLFTRRWPRFIFNRIFNGWSHSI